MTLLLGLDVGTTSVKVGLFDETGRQLSAAGREYALDHPAPDRAELDAEFYWSATVSAVRGVLEAASADPSAVAAIAVSSQGESIVAVDSAGLPLGKALIWLDNRAGEEAGILSEKFGDADVYARTGIPAVNPTWPASKILWWRRHDPGLFAAASHFLLVEDFVLHRLTGEFITNGGVQCTSMLFDIGRHAWWAEMLEAVGIGPDRLPIVVAPGSVVGNLAASAARELGLPRSVAVVAGGMDQSVGAVGVGNIGSGVISESTGGALTLQASVAVHGADATRQTPVYIHSAPDQYLYCPVCPTGGMALTWFRDRFGTEEIARATEGGPTAYERLTDLAAAVPAGCEGLTMLPHLMGAFSPEYNPLARGVFYGFTLHHGKGHFVRAVLEAVAFMLRRNLELLASVGAEALEIRSHGGGARSHLWNQIKADSCGLPVVTLQGDDAAVRGNAMLAAVATGVFADLAAAGDAMVIPQRRYEPDPTNRAVYDAAYGRYLQLFDDLRPLFELSGSEPADRS
jgi:xylulokinase